MAKKEEIKKGYFDNLKSQFLPAVKQIQPIVAKVAIDTTRGYLFGSIFGVFSKSKRSVIDSMHQNGKNFAKMSAIYSVSEITLEKIRGKTDTYSSVYSGMLAGAVGSKDNKIIGSAVFGAYSGLSHYLGSNK